MLEDLRLDLLALLALLDLLALLALETDLLKYLVIDFCFLVIYLIYLYHVNWPS
jgi:hypothetical protein